MNAQPDSDRLYEQQTKTLPRPYLLLLKLQAGRTQDLADVQRLLRGTNAEERAALRSIVSRYAADLVEDFDALVMLADLEFGAAG